MYPGRFKSNLVFAVSMSLFMTLPLAPGVFAQEGPAIKPGARPWSSVDERPEAPSALGRHSDRDTLVASRRGAESMGGGMERIGRWHLTVRRLYQPNPVGLPVSETMEYAAEGPSPTFEDPEALRAAFRAALAGNGIVAFSDLLGLRAEKLLDDGAALQAFVAIRNGLEHKLEIDDRGGSQILLIGEEGWPFPYPIVRDEDGNWSFDTLAGLQEIVNRRIGENELEALATARAYLEAQRAYSQEDRDDDGVREYARNLVSSEGTRDGLFWPASTADGDSPGGEFVYDAERYGGYHGYRFRILKSQGENAPGSSHDYAINGNMIAGFALLAWPARYARTGLHSFLISHHGTAYEADLGVPTAAIAPYINEFNPAKNWAPVSD